MNVWNFGFMCGLSRYFNFGGATIQVQVSRQIGRVLRCLRTLRPETRKVRIMAGVLH